MDSSALLPSSEGAGMDVVPLGEYSFSRGSIYPKGAWVGYLAGAELELSGIFTRPRSDACPHLGVVRVWGYRVFHTQYACFRSINSPRINKQCRFGRVKCGKSEDVAVSTTIVSCTTPRSMRGLCRRIWRGCMLCCWFEGWNGKCLQDYGRRCLPPCPVLVRRYCRKLDRLGGLSTEPCGLYAFLNTWCVIRMI